LGFEGSSLVRDITLATFQEKPVYGSVMIAGGFLLRPPLDPAQFWIFDHIDELYILHGGDRD